MLLFTMHQDVLAWTKKKFLDHPTCSPDLNPIENLWGLTVAKVYEGVYEDTWEKIPLIQLQKLVDSMPNRIFEVIKANSGSTKY